MALEVVFEEDRHPERAARQAQSASSAGYPKQVRLSPAPRRAWLAERRHRLGPGSRRRSLRPPMLSATYESPAAEHEHPCSFLHCLAALIQPSPHGCPLRQIRQHCCGACAVDMGSGATTGPSSAWLSPGTAVISNSANARADAMRDGRSIRFGGTKSSTVAGPSVSSSGSGSPSA